MTANQVSNGGNGRIRGWLTGGVVFAAAAVGMGYLADGQMAHEDLVNQEGIRHALTVESTIGTSDTVCVLNVDGIYEVHTVGIDEAERGVNILQVDESSFLSQVFSVVGIGDDSNGVCFYTTAPPSPSGNVVYNAPFALPYIIK